MEIVTISKKSRTPKYRQIIESIEKAILSGKLRLGDKLPSLNSIKTVHSLSRDTVLTAFNELKVRGIIDSVVGKGYYVKSLDIEVEKKVFMLFDELNSFKEDLYYSFLKNLGDNGKVEIFFHHFNRDIFQKLISDNVGAYTDYVIMPANLENIAPILEQLPKEKVYILDQMHPDLREYSSIFQNFETDIYAGLSKAVNRIKKYQRTILLFQPDKQPLGLLDGYRRFCKDNDIKYEILRDTTHINIRIADLYLVLDDKHLILLIKKMKEEKLVILKDVGIISYNDTMLKEIVEGGITTISTDFEYMGKQLATMLIQNEMRQIENPSKLILRNSV